MVAFGSVMGIRLSIYVTGKDFSLFVFTSVARELFVVLPIRDNVQSIVDCGIYLHFHH